VSPDAGPRYLSPDTSVARQTGRRPVSNSGSADRVLLGIQSLRWP